eukprot:g1603.t1
MSDEPPSLARKSIDSALGCLQRHFPYRPGIFGARKFNEKKLKLKKEIARGSFGKVYIAEYFEDIVAVKELFRQSTEDDDFYTTRRSLADMIMKEASILEQKRSPHIVQLIHFSLEKGWLVMPYFKNGSLDDVMNHPLKRGIVEDWRNRLKWMRSIALGMNVVHNGRPQVIHRDLKLSNIFVDADYNAVVGDFGLAKQLFSEFDLKSFGSMDGMCKIWQPKEVIERGLYSTKSDVYSYGIIMHQMLTLGAPYGLSSSLSFFEARVQNHVRSGTGLEVPEDLSELPGKWHPCLEEYIKLMEQCCAENPDHRPDFGVISKTMKSIEEKYNKAMQPEALNEKFWLDKSFKWTFVISALSLCAISSLLNSVVHTSLKTDLTEITFVNSLTYIGLICGLLGLLPILTSFISLCWNQGKRIFQLENNTSSVGLHDENVLMSFQQDNEDTLIRSPFEDGAPMFGDRIRGSDISSTGVNLPIPDRELWNQICEGFISELHDSENPRLHAILKFCQTCKNEQLQLSRWEVFVRLLSTALEVKDTATWTQYQMHLSIPSFFTQGFLSVQDGDESDSQGNEVDSAAPEVESASRHFDRGLQLEMHQLSDTEFLFRTVFPRIQSTENANFEIAAEAASQNFAIELHQNSTGSPRHNGE